MKQIVVRLIIAITLAACVQGCASISPDPDDESTAERDQEFNRMDRMLNPSPNTGSALPGDQ
jgi:hypothetical protein